MVGDYSSWSAAEPIAAAAWTKRPILLVRCARPGWDLRAFRPKWPNGPALENAPAPCLDADGFPITVLAMLG